MTGMEAALVSGVLKVAGGKLVSLIASQFASITGVKKDLCELKDTHDDITELLRDRAIEGGTPPPWVNKLRNIAYDIDDLLYEVQLQAEKHKMESDVKKQLIPGWGFRGKPKSFAFRCKVAHKMKAIKVEFAAIVKQRIDANTIRNNLPADHPVGSRNSTTGELSMLGNVEDSKIPKRDEEKGKIICKILEANEGVDGSTIVSIVGLGGSGKTTLAKHVCHDSKIKEHFVDKVFWVHVSEESFDEKKLIGKLFQAITKQNSHLYAPEHMLHEISNKLDGKKFLLVLDDAWHPGKLDWEKFMVHLKNGAPGIKILLTTRDKKVAELVNSSYILELAFLEESDSWELFLKCSGWKEEDLASEFIKVGKETLNKCSGVPLAIRTVGGILCEKKEISFWKAIRDSDLWKDESIKDRVFASLKLSFIHLPDVLKQCFMFCSIFPKGYEIYKDGLIAQWVAHGFINSMDGVQSEDIGRDYFDSVVKVGFLQDPSSHWYTNHLVCTIHDLIHDLTRQILSDEVRTSLPNNTQRCRYLSLTSCAEKVDRRSFYKVHALFVSEGNPRFDKPVKKSSCIRSIVLDYTNSTKFPQFILKFEYLGYLEIHNLSCKRIPEAISCCWNLLSLHFIRCKDLVMLPESIGKLKKLRTLELNYATELESLPLSIGDCRDLQSFNLHYCEKVKIPSTTCKIRNLRALRVSGCSFLKQLPSELTGEFSNLQIINLAYCIQLEDLPSTLSCPMLRTLDLSGTKVNMLPPWVTRASTLECQNLENCSELVELPKDIGKLKWLEVLNIADCTKLLCLPSGIGQLTRLRQLGLFVVGCGGDEARISELENLDMLSGEMVITNLKYVKDPCDAEKACLKRKNRIQELELNWSLSDTDKELAPNVEQEQGVLSALEPPKQIMDLKIKGYRGTCLPWWMMKHNDSSYCEDTLSQQTSPCQFMSLTHLNLSYLPNLKHVRGLSEFPSLQFLTLWSMPQLEELWTTSGSETGEEALKAQCCFPALYQLSILWCPKLLSVKPYFPPSLEKLTLSGYESLQLLAPGNFFHPLRSTEESSSSYNVLSTVPHLRGWELTGMSSSIWLGIYLQNHTELETLMIQHSDDLTQLPESIRSLTSLWRLWVFFCPALAELPEWLGELRSLKELHVCDGTRIAGLPQSMKHLTSLVELAIGCGNNLDQLPDVIQHLTALEVLTLEDCAAMTVLPEWIGQLSKLRRLAIYRCPGLQCLPQSIRGLTALEVLDIGRCTPDFARRYKEGTGADWHLVSGISSVDIRT